MEDRTLEGRAYAVLEDGCFCFLSLADGTTVFRYPMRTNSD